MNRQHRGFAEKAEATARRERAIQQQVERSDKARNAGRGRKSRPTQAGART